MSRTLHWHWSLLALCLTACGGTQPTVVETPTVPEVKTAAPVAQKKGVSQHAAKLFEEGVSALKADSPDYLKAVEAFKAATDDSPDYDIAWLNLAYSYEKLGRYSDSAKAYRSLSARGVQERGLTLALGRSLLMTGDADQAIAEFEKVLQEKPDDLEARNNLAAAYIAKDNTDIALRYVKEVLAVQPKNISAIINLGLLYLRQNKLALAELMFKKAIGYDEKNAQALNNLGIVYYKTNEVPAAVQSFNQAIAADETLDEARLNVASIYLDYLDYASALPQFKAVRARFPKHYEAMVGEADALYGTQEYAAAAQVFEESLTLRNDNPEVLLRVGKLYEGQLGQPKKAAAHYKRYCEVKQLPADDPMRATIQFLEQMEEMPPASADEASTDKASEAQETE